MTKAFTASNGVTIEIQEDGYLLATRYRGTGCSEVERDVHATGSPSHGIAALREYFEHERTLAEKPWLDAEEGDVWLITLPQGTYPAIFQADMFGDIGGRWSPVDVISARKLWPVDE